MLHRKLHSVSEENLRILLQFVVRRVQLTGFLSSPLFCSVLETSLVFKSFRFCFL